MRRSIPLMLAMLLLTAELMAAEAGSGNVYAVVELTFSGPMVNPSDVPSRDIDFWARFQHESGSPTYKIHGFWDGDGQGGMQGNIFRIRFCPTKPGRWIIVEVSSNRSELQGEKQGDHITATTSSLRGFWEVDQQNAGGRWYRRSDGSHQYIVGNTMYSFISEMYTDNKPNGSDIAKDIRGNAQYFKKVRFSAIGDRYPHPTDKPFLSNSGQQTDDGANSHRPNPLWFSKRVDLAVKTAFELDLIADLIMSGVDMVEKRKSLQAANNGGDPSPFFKYLVARYGAYPNVWYCVINEFNHVNQSPRFNATQMRNFGTKIKSYMAYPSPLSVHHMMDWETGLNMNPPWNDHIVYQDKIKSLGTAADMIKKNYSLGGSNKPAVNDELSYQGAGDGHSEADTIEAHFGAFLGAGYGTTGYKSGTKLGQYFAGNFNASTHSSADNLLFMRQKIDSEITFWRMVPTGSSVLSGGVRSLGWEGNEYVTGTNKGVTVTANLPSGSWTIKVWDIFAKSEKIVSTNATGRVTIAAPSSRAGLIHAKRNGSSPPSTNSLTLELSEGWNLVSFPIASATAVETVLSGISGKFDALYEYDATEVRYRSYIPGEGGDLSSIRNGAAYWIYMNAGATLRLDQPSFGAPVALTRGWNLVGYVGQSEASLDSALSTFAGKYMVVYGYSGGAYRVYEPGAGGDLNSMRPGQGFWIYATEDATWDVE